MCLDSGPAASRRPGMTACEFSANCYPGRRRTAYEPTLFVPHGNAPSAGFRDSLCGTGSSSPRRPRSRDRFESVAQMLQPQCRPPGQTDDQIQLAADRLHVASQRRKIHVGLLLNLRHRGLLDLQRTGDVGLRLARDTPKLAQALDLRFHLAIACVDQRRRSAGRSARTWFRFRPISLFLLLPCPSLQQLQMRREAARPGAPESALRPKKFNPLTHHRNSSAYDIPSME